MEVLLLALAAAFGLVALDRRAKARPAPPSSPIVLPPASPGPKPTPAPIPSGPLPPGVYPAGTAGAFPIQLFVQGGDNDARLYATPGSYAGPQPPKTVTVWYGPGTVVEFRATVDPIPGPIQFTAFDHFEGPGGVTTRQNPFSIVIGGLGYVRAVFATLGRVG